MKQNQASFLFRYAVRSMAILVVLGVLLRAFFVSSFVVSGQSMLPSVWPGDFIITTKWNPLSPARGDIVALRCPNDPERNCLQRIVGLPGDRIEFDKGQLIFNGNRAGTEPMGEGGVTETIDGRSWWILPAADEPLADVKGGPVVVPPQQIYLLNDRRSYPADSRLWGPVSADLIEGRAVRVWLSLDWFDGDEVRTWPRVRWERMLLSIN